MNNRALVEAALFMARRDGRDVGRIAGWINHRANQFLDEKVAGFGFFETFDDYEIAQALLDAVCDWACGQGMETIRGPFHFSMDDSPGVLIEGFDRPPVLMCGHSPPYYANLLERYGLVKYRDEWMTAEEKFERRQRDMGLVKFEGKWMTPEEMRKDILLSYRIGQRWGRHILAMSHMMQYTMPAENIQAILDTVGEIRAGRHG